jgi:hypothetical protein
MTLKKSMISIAAAGVIAATITGCGSSSGGSSNGGGSTAQPTSITATDGYVYNYNVTATYADGNESNRTYGTTAVLTDAVSKTTKAAGQAQVAGSATMNLKDVLTDDQLDNLRYVTLSQAPQTTDGTTITYQTFFDANGDGLFDTAAGDVLVPAGFTMKAPAGFKMITPLTTLVQARIDTLTASDVNDSNRSEKAALALTQIASALGLTADKIKNIDPMDTVETDPAYALINALAGQLITDTEVTAVSTALATATAATTVSAALNNIAAGATASKSLFTDAANQLAADADMINTVSSWNLDALRNTTAAQTAFNPTNLTASAADFNVSDIEINSIAASTLAGAGAKIKEADLNDVTFELDTSSEANVSNKMFKLVLDLRTQETYIAADANVSSLTVVVPFELNSTVNASKVIDGKISGNIIWNGVDGAGNTFTGEMNATEFASRSGVTAIDVTDDGDVTIQAHKILTTADSNSSNKVGVDALDASIANIKMAIVDSENALQKTNAAGTASAYWGNTAIASVYGAIVETGKTILKNTLVDGRAANTASPAVNAAPAHALTLNGKETGTGTTAAPFIINNNSPLSLALAANGSTDAAEKNTTITIAASSTDLDLNTSNIISKAKANVFAATAAGSEFNTTSTTAGDLNYTITTVATDEFGESNTTTYYITANRAPVKATFVEYNTTAITIATDVDRHEMSLGTDTATDVGNAIAGRSLDVNVSAIVSLAGKLILDFNSTITGLDINISNTTDVNDTYELNATMGDLNITL